MGFLRLFWVVFFTANPVLFGVLGEAADAEEAGRLQKRLEMLLADAHLAQIYKFWKKEKNAMGHLD